MEIFKNIILDTPRNVLWIGMDCKGEALLTDLHNLFLGTIKTKMPYFPIILYHVGILYSCNFFKGKILGNRCFSYIEGPLY